MLNRMKSTFRISFRCVLLCGLAIVLNACGSSFRAIDTSSSRSNSDASPTPIPLVGNWDSGCIVLGDYSLENTLTVTAATTDNSGAVTQAPSALFTFTSFADTLCTPANSLAEYSVGGDYLTSTPFTTKGAASEGGGNVVTPFVYTINQVGFNMLALSLAQAEIQGVTPAEYGQGSLFTNSLGQSLTDVGSPAFQAIAPSGSFDPQLDGVTTYLIFSVKDNTATFDFGDVWSGAPSCLNYTWGVNGLDLTFPSAYQLMLFFQLGQLDQLTPSEPCLYDLEMPTPYYTQLLANPSSSPTNNSALSFTRQP